VVVATRRWKTRWRGEDVVKISEKHRHELVAAMACAATDVVTRVVPCHTTRWSSRQQLMRV
jgi:hypothetical protein